MAILRPANASAYPHASRASRHRLNACHARAAPLKDHKLTTQVMADHVRLDLDLVEHLAVVHTNDGANHLWYDDHVPQVRLDRGGLLKLGALLLSLPELLDESHGLPVQAAGKLAAHAGRDELHQLLRAQVKKRIEVDAAVRKLAKRPLTRSGRRNVRHDGNRSRRGGETANRRAATEVAVQGRKTRNAANTTETDRDAVPSASVTAAVSSEGDPNKVARHAVLNHVSSEVVKTVVVVRSTSVGSIRHEIRTSPRENSFQVSL